MTKLKAKSTPRPTKKNPPSVDGHLLPLIVQKYGGATLSDPAKIKQVAARLAQLSKSGKRVIAVVSAMGQSTNQLLEIAQQISPIPNRRELDMLLSTGERVSMALLSMALHDLGCQAISFTGSQAGILTDESHLNAYIQDVKAPRLEEALKAGKIVVLAGFQGVSPLTKEITTLGRGGSDITAIAIASALKADHCEILKDVPAVFSGDPHLIPGAWPLQHLNYDQLSEMTFWGAKVLHYRSVELAKINQVALYVGPASDDSAKGTQISATHISANGEKMFELNKILAVNSHDLVLEIGGRQTHLTEALQALENFLTGKEIPLSATSWFFCRR